MVRKQPGDLIMFWLSCNVIMRIVWASYRFRMSVLHSRSDARWFDDDIVDDSLSWQWKIIIRCLDIFHDCDSNSPAQTMKYDKSTKKKTVLADGIGTETLFNLRFGGSSTRNGILYKNSNIFTLVDVLSAKLMYDEYFEPHLNLKNCLNRSVNCHRIFPLGLTRRWFLKRY